MYRKYYLVEAVILLLLSHGGWNGPSVTLLSCTSESSKLIQNVIQEQLLPVVSRYGAILPLECPLHPQRDIFWWVRTETEEVELYKCPICGERFRFESGFVIHWDASHSRNLGLIEETVCLDHYCDVLRCDVLRQKEKLAVLQEQNPAHVPSHNTQDRLRGPENQAKGECDPKSMAMLANKCRAVIRQCTIGMVANLSSKDFQNLEADLDNAICSYLTCEKYWDDFDPKVYHIPTIVCIMLGLLVSSGFCLCYYGTWVLMENHYARNPGLCSRCRKPRPRSRQRREPHLRRRDMPTIANTSELRQNGTVHS